MIETKIFLRNAWYIAVLDSTREFTSSPIFGFILIQFLIIPVTVAGIGDSEVKQLVRKSRVSGPDTISLAFYTVEEDHIGTIVGNIHSQMVAKKGGSFIPPKEKSIFLEVKANRYLTLEKSSGNIMIRSRINREALCGEAGTCCTFNQPVNIKELSFNTFTNEGRFSRQLFADCALRLLILHDPKDARFIEVIVYILDINDNVPVWPMKLLSIDIPEHVALGSRYSLPEAVDLDQDPINTVTSYRLVVANVNTLKEFCHDCITKQQHEIENTEVYTTNLFSLETQLIETSSMSAQKFELTLRVNGDLDREAKSNYYLILFAYDGVDQQTLPPNTGYFRVQPVGTHTKHTGSLTIQVNLIDVNDHAPIFPEKIGVIKISDSTSAGSVVFRAYANDLDTSDGDKLVYKIGTAATPDVHNHFSINASTGELKVSRALNYQTAIYLSHVPNGMSNNAYPGSPNQFWLAIGYVVPIVVSDGLSQDEMQLYVLLTRVNKQAPVLSVASHLKLSPTRDRLWVREDASPGTLLAIINYDDPDADIAQHLDYTHEKPTDVKNPECFTKQDLFAVQPVSSKLLTEFKLTLRRSLDRETEARHSVLIECWDVGNPPMSSTLSIDINVEDVDDSPPIFDRSIYTAKVAEGLPTNTFIIRVRATDADVGQNAKIRYRLLNHLVKPATELNAMEINFAQENKIYIAVNENTGVITSQQVFDRELIAAINCTIVASQPSRWSVIHPGNSSLSVTSQQAITTVVISIEDLNDCQPEFNVSSYEFSAPEGPQSGSRIGRVFATDSDASSANNLIRYSMRPIPGPLGQLATDYVSVSSDGIIYIRKNRLDREQASILNFEVLAIDSGRPSLTGYASVLIRVLDVNDNAPVWLFPRPGGQAGKTVINVSHYTAVGTQLAHLRALDADEGENGEVRYSIVHGNEAGFLDVNPITGVLTLTKSLVGFTVNNSNSGNTGHLRSRNKQPNDTVTKNVQKPSAVIHVQRLVFKATDRGQPPRFNTTVLDVAIVNMFLSTNNRVSLKRGDRSDPTRGSSTDSANGDQGYARIRWVEHDLIVMIILIALTSFISVVLLLAICLIRYNRGALCSSRWTSASGTQHMRRYDTKTPASNWLSKLCFPCWYKGSDINRWIGDEQQNKHLEGGSTDCSEETSHRYLSRSTNLYSPQRTCSSDRPPLGSDQAELQGFYYTIHPDSGDGLQGQLFSNLVAPNHDCSSHQVTPGLKNAYLVEVNSRTLDSPPYSVLHAKPLKKEYTGVYYQPLQPASSQLPVMVNNATDVSCCQLNQGTFGGRGKHTCCHDNRCASVGAPEATRDSDGVDTKQQSLLTFVSKNQKAIAKTHASH